MKRWLISVPILLLGLSTPAFAHPGHGPEAGFVTGLLHPLTGLDHLLAMLMVGLFSGLAFPKRVWLAPMAFVAFMLIGFGFGAAGGYSPFAEALILASLFGLGVTLVFELKPPVAAALPIIALFAIGHGFAHGSEMAPGSNGLKFALGFVVTTVMLHLAGIALARIARRPRAGRIGQVVGATATATAVAMLWTS